MNIRFFLSFRSASVRNDSAVTAPICMNFLLCSSAQRYCLREAGTAYFSPHLGHEFPLVKFVVASKTGLSDNFDLLSRSQGFETSGARAQYPTRSTRNLSDEVLVSFSHRHCRERNLAALPKRMTLYAVSLAYSIFYEYIADSSHTFRTISSICKKRKFCNHQNKVEEHLKYTEQVDQTNNEVCSTMQNLPFRRPAAVT